MKILFISQFAGSAHHGMVTRNYNWGIEMKKLGHEVTIITSSYSHYRTRNPDQFDKMFAQEIIDDIHYKWLKTTPYSGESTLGRLKAIVQFQWRLSCYLRHSNDHYDLIIASSPQPFVIYPARRLAKKCQAKLIFDIRDLWPLTLKELGGLSRWHPFVMALQHAENYACRHADLVTAVPQNCESYLKDKGLSDNKFLHIGNSTTLKDLSEAPSLPKSHQDYINNLKSKNAFVIGYAGTLGRANAMHIAIQAMAKTPSNIHMIIIGDGHQAAELKVLVNKLNLAERVHFLPPVQSGEVPAFLNLIDVAYIGALKSNLYKWGASPAKMNDYMMAAKPILYAIGDPNNPVEQSGGGISCMAEDIEGLAKSMTNLQRMPHKDLIETGQKGHQWLIDNQLTSAQVQKILSKLYS